MFASLKSFLGGSVDPNFPYDIQDELPTQPPRCVWRVCKGVNKNDSSAVTIFRAIKKDIPEQEYLAAQHAVKRMRTLRHPTVLKFLGSTEKAVEFLSGAGLTHRNVSMSAVFVTPQGDWKLGGMELLASKETNYEELPMRPHDVYEPPEVKKGQHGRGHPWSIDMWGLGCLCHEAHQGLLNSPSDLKTMDKMPKSIIPHYAVLISANPKSRPSPQEFQEQGRLSGKYFKNDFIDTVLFLEELAVKEKEDVAMFYKKLPDLIDDFPRDLSIKKLLPQLLQAFQYGGAGYQVLAPMLKIGKLLNEDEYKTLIVPSLVKLFASPDRATRISLLKKLGDFIEYLDTSIVTNDIFPSVSQGFSDTVPAMREETVKSMLHFAPKLTTKALDAIVAKTFPRLQTDEKPGIRTNTTVCMGKIAQHLSPKTRQATLGPAFLKALKDSFVPARLAGISALNLTAEYFAPMECAKRLLPVVIGLTMDPEYKVRQQAFQVVHTMLERLEAHSLVMKEQADVKAAEAEANPAVGDGPRSGTTGDVAAGATALLSWASSNLVKPAADTPKPSGNPTPSKPLPAQPAKAVEEDDEFHDCEDNGDNGDSHDKSDTENGWGDEDVAPWDALEAEAEPVKTTRGKATSLGRPRRGMQLGGRKKEPVASLATQVTADDNSGWGADEDLHLEEDTTGQDGWGAQDEELDLGDGDGWGNEGWNEPASTPSQPVLKPRVAVKTEDDEKEARRLAREARKAKAEERRAAKTAVGGGGVKRKGLGAVKKD